MEYRRLIPKFDGAISVVVSSEPLGISATYKTNIYESSETYDMDFAELCSFVDGADAILRLNLIFRTSKQEVILHKNDRQECKSYVPQYRVNRKINRGRSSIYVKINAEFEVDFEHDGSDEYAEHIFEQLQKINLLSYKIYAKMKRTEQTISLRLRKNIYLSPFVIIKELRKIVNDINMCNIVEHIAESKMQLLSKTQLLSYVDTVIATIHI